MVYLVFRPVVSRASSSHHRVQRKEAVTADGKKKKPVDVQVGEILPRYKKYEILFIYVYFELYS